VAKTNKGLSKKEIWDSLWQGDGWNVVSGRLKQRIGRPFKNSHLFYVVAEKLPYECFKEVRKQVRSFLDDQGVERNGVYMAHDSMGVARYGGRGQIFMRLASHKKKYPKQLLYFSFYIIRNKQHEREIETAILRAAGSQMVLNQKKIAQGLDTGNVADYEPGTYFVQRQRKKGPGNH
jgi:hypothetical protein